MLGWQSNLGPAGKRLFQPDRQPILITAGDERRPRSAANCRVRVSLQEAHALRRNGINIRSAKIGASVTGDVSVSQTSARMKTILGASADSFAAMPRSAFRATAAANAPRRKSRRVLWIVPMPIKAFLSEKCGHFIPKDPAITLL